MNSLRSAGNYLSNKVKAGGHTASKETNKQIAKDPNVRTSTRIRAAGDAMKDKVNESSHNRRAEANRHAAKHNY